MRYATVTAASYCGIDLHARTMYVVVLDAQGNTRLERNLPSSPDAFLQALAPFLPDVVVACECVHTWYWLADRCAAQQIPFVLGHAFGMRAVHQSKTKSDPHDAHAIARLLRGGVLPMAYPYPRERRSLRDLLRARLRFVRLRARTQGHVHATLRQLNLPAVSSDVKSKSKRGGIAENLPDPHPRRAVEAELELLGPLDARCWVRVASGRPKPAWHATSQGVHEERSTPWPPRDTPARKSVFRDLFSLDLVIL